MEEKYFVFCFDEEGTVQWITWFKNPEEAKQEADQIKIRYPQEADSIYVGELLV